MATIQKEMLARAVAERNSKITTCLDWAGFVPALEQKHMVLTPWCEDPESEEEVKKKSTAESEGGAAKTLCIPFEQPPLPEGTKCFITGRPATCWTLWGRSY
jgi:prolyl-tRNA synthetase